MTPDEFLTEATQALKGARTQEQLIAARDLWMEGELWENQPEFIREDLTALLRREVERVFGALA